MKAIVKFLKRYGYAIFLGVALSEIANIGLQGWRFYAFISPLIILINWGYRPK